jgi:ketose-bisphosphate aldolase
MIDGSRLSYKENVELTRHVVSYAKLRGVAVEGEIGILGAKEVGEVGKDSHDKLSTPELTFEFVKDTGVDSVAVAIGNEHGAPENEVIDLDLLYDIAKLVKIPLVIHGSSGISKVQVREAIKLGVAKFNIDTLIRRAFISGMRHIDPDEHDYRNVLENSMHEVKAVVKERVRLLRMGY